MKSTAQLLADLLAPSPAPNDPEAVDALDDGPALLQSDDEGDAAPTRPLKIKPEKRLRRAELQMDDMTYGGRKILRKDVEPRESGQPARGSKDDDSVSEADLSGSESEGSGGSFDMSDDEDETGLRQDKFGGLSGREGNYKSALEPTDDGNESEGASSLDSLDGVPPAAAFAAIGQGDEQDAGWRQLEEEFATLQSRSAKATAPAAQGSRSNKAAAVATQCKLWNSVLGIRITLQRSLVAADRLPRGAAHACMMEDVPEAPDSVADARHAAIGAIGECMNTMHDLLSRVAPCGDGSSAAPSAMHDAEALASSERRASSALWPQLEQLESRFCTFRDNEIDRWHRKTMLATGQTALKGVGGMQALNKPLSQQVSDVLRAPERALQRVRRQRQEHDSVLCEGQPRVESSAAQGLETGDGSVDTHVDAPGGDGAGSAAVLNASGEGEAARLGTGLSTASAAEGREEWRLRRATLAAASGDIARDVESFDDSAFYQVLLQEFLESAQANGLLAESLKMPKHRKLVDRRASKGRKIRFNIMNKLVNFMDPVQMYEDDADGRISSLYGNLFGHAAR